MKLNFYALTTLPATLEADSLYFIQNGNKAETYLTSSSGEARGIGNTAMITEIVNAAIASAQSAQNALKIYDNITARDVDTLESDTMALVVDASADSTVNSGSALYAYRHSDTSFIKVSEYESMDIVLNWDSIQGKPSATPTQIDNAVSQSHSHSNKATLDKFGESEGNPTYDGNPISTAWTTKNW